MPLSSDSRPFWYVLAPCKALLVHTRAIIPFTPLSLLQSSLFLFALFDTALSLATMQRSAVTAVLLLLLAFLGELPLYLSLILELGRMFTMCT